MTLSYALDSLLPFPTPCFFLMFMTFVWVLFGLGPRNPGEEAVQHPQYHHGKWDVPRADPQGQEWR